MKSVDNIEQRKVEKLKEKAHTDDDSKDITSYVIICDGDLIQLNFCTELFVSAFVSSLCSINIYKYKYISYHSWLMFEDHLIANSKRLNFEDHLIANSETNVPLL